MNHYRLLEMHTLRPMELVELHVLARAYRDAWRLLHGSEPLHDHAITSLNLLIHFYPVNKPAGAAA